MLNLIKIEFIKNYNLKKVFLILLILLIGALFLLWLEETFGHYTVYTMENYNETTYKVLKKDAKARFEKTNLIFDKDIEEITEEIKPIYHLILRHIKNHREDMWQKKILILYMKEYSHKKALIRLEEKISSKEIDNYVVGYENEGQYDEYHIIKEEYMDYLYNYKERKTEEKLKEVEEKLVKLEKAIQENSYYLYVDYMCTTYNWKYLKENDRMTTYCDYITKNKIKEEYDYRVVNLEEYVSFNELKNSYELNTSKEERERKKNNRIKEIYKNQEKIVKYAFEKEMKHDLKFPERGASLSYHGTYQNTKNYVNKGLSFGVIITLLLILLNSGIVSKEHETGTIKLLLTSPISRKKLLLSKFFYLVINMYLLWIVGIILLVIISGIKYGFSDLMIKELVLIGGEVKEINYLLWYIGELIMVSIPVIGMLSFLFFLSTTIKNTAITSSITTALTILSIFLWFIIDSVKLKLLDSMVYTPLVYLNFNVIRENNTHYLATITTSKLNGFLYGLGSNLLLTILLLGISIHYYKKIDIVNRN